ncbi:MAG: hypothetical protein ABR881_10250 [Candidatus Sulfotelmatobacter sp.]
MLLAPASKTIDEEIHRRGIFLRGGGMAKTKLTSGMWRIDPQKWSRVIDRCGQPVASVEADADSNANASLIAAAPDMFELLETLENDASIPEEVHEEIQLVLRRARGDFGFAVFSRNISRHLRSRTQDWLKFMEGLWKSNGGTE